MYVCDKGPNRYHFDGDCCPLSLGPPKPSRHLAGVRIGVAGIVIAPEVDTATAALDDSSTSRGLAGVQIEVAGAVSSSSKSTTATGIVYTALDIATSTGRYSLNKKQN